jgi:hypothetical protein
MQDVIQALVKRTLITSERDENTLESGSPKDAYVLTIGMDGLPVRLIYRIADGNAPIQVEYSNYLKVADTRYPGKISIGRLNESPSWVFVLNNVKSKFGG